MSCTALEIPKQRDDVLLYLATWVREREGESGALAAMRYILAVCATKQHSHPRTSKVLTLAAKAPMMSVANCAKTDWVSSLADHHRQKIKAILSMFIFKSL